jgi:hypothetical protein
VPNDGGELRKGNGFLLVGKEKNLVTFALENPVDQDSCVSLVIQNQNA